MDLFALAVTTVAPAALDAAPGLAIDLTSLIGSPLAAVGTATLIGSYVLKGRIAGKFLPLATGAIATALLGLAWASGSWTPEALTVDGLAAPLFAIVTLIGPAGLFEFLRATPLPVGKSAEERAAVIASHERNRPG